jgi:hypothetical protein
LGLGLGLGLGLKLGLGLGLGLGFRVQGSGFRVEVKAGVIVRVKDTVRLTSDGLAVVMTRRIGNPWWSSDKDSLSSPSGLGLG